MQSAQAAPEETLEQLFAPPSPPLRPPPPVVPAADLDVESLLGPLRRALVERLLREGLGG